MKKFIKYTGTVVPIMYNNIDTDQIIPKQFLKSIKRTGFQDALFHEWRYNSDGTPNKEFNLNRAQYKKGRILITGENFGCGSSREHAVWALQDYGFHVIIAGSYSDIFYMNWVNNGHLPIILPKNSREEISNISGDTEVVIDLEGQLIKIHEKIYNFKIEETWKKKLLMGLDPIGETLELEGKIEAYEKNNGI